MKNQSKIEKIVIRFAWVIACLWCGNLATFGCAQTADPLPSWKDGPTKTAILDFVTRVTTEGGADYVKPAERIATFDNDGCLWSEKPFYFQLQFAIDRVKALAKDHPEWKTTQPFKAVLENDLHIRCQVR